MTEPRLVVLSHKRHRTITTHRHVADTVVCVPESQADQYANAIGRDNVVAHPDAVVGLAAKCQWCYERWGDLAMLDDDSKGFIRTDAKRAGRTIEGSSLTPEQARDRILDTAATAAEIGAYLYGFASPFDAQDFDTSTPFRFGGLCVGTVTGLRRGSGLWFPKDLTYHQDVWISLLNAHFHRYLLVDRRFSLHCGMPSANEGGLREFDDRDGANSLRQAQRIVRTFGLHREPGKLLIPPHVDQTTHVISAKLPWSHD